MIRYVLAVMLTTTLFGMAAVGVEHAGEIRAETQVETGISTIDEAALSLLERESPPPPGQNGARRVAEIDLPDGGFLSASVETLVLERQSRTNVTLVTYRISGQAEQTKTIHAPIEHAHPARDVLDFSGSGGSHVIVLELHRDENGAPVIEATTEI